MCTEIQSPQSPKHRTTPIPRAPRFDARAHTRTHAPGLGRAWPRDDTTRHPGAISHPRAAAPSAPCRHFISVAVVTHSCWGGREVVAETTKNKAHNFRSPTCSATETPPASPPRARGRKLCAPCSFPASGIAYPPGLDRTLNEARAVGHAAEATATRAWDDRVALEHTVTVPCVHSNGWLVAAHRSSTASRLA